MTHEKVDVRPVHPGLLLTEVKPQRLCVLVGPKILPTFYVKPSFSPKQVLLHHGLLVGQSNALVQPVAIVVLHVADAVKGALKELGTDGL